MGSLRRRQTELAGPQHRPRHYSSSSYELCKQMAIYTRASRRRPEKTTAPEHRGLVACFRSSFYSPSQRTSVSGFEQFLPGGTRARLREPEGNRKGGGRNGGGRRFTVRGGAGGRGGALCWGVCAKNRTASCHERLNAHTHGQQHGLGKQFIYPSP